MNKKVKVTEYWRKNPRYIHLHKTKWQVFVDKVKTFFKVLLGGILMVAILFGIGLLSINTFPKTVVKLQEKEVVLDNLSAKIDQLKGELIKDIFDNERAGHTEEDALITWDPNPKYPKVEAASVGNCQWKIPTLQESYLKHYGEQLTRKQAVLIALDDEKCKEVMTKVIFGEENGWRKWYNSGIKVKAEQRLQVIRELEK